MSEKRYKIVVYAPELAAEDLRFAMGEAGAGTIGNYSHCMFTTKGESQFLPGEGADPVVGNVGELTKVEEYRIETLCDAAHLAAVVAAIRKAHPYEEPAFDVYPVELVS